MSVLTSYFVLEYPSSLNILYWNIPADQKRLLIDHEPHGQAYLFGMEPWTIILGMFGVHTHPQRLLFSEVGSQKARFVETVRPLLLEMRKTFRPIVAQLATMNPTGMYRELFLDIASSAKVFVARVEQMYHLYEGEFALCCADDLEWPRYTAALGKANPPSTLIVGPAQQDRRNTDHTPDENESYEPLEGLGSEVVRARAAAQIELAESALRRAETEVRAQESRYPNRRIRDWDPLTNSTVYPHGYLWTVHSLYFFWRDQSVVRSRIRFPTYLNIRNPIDTVYGPGLLNDFLRFNRRLAENFFGSLAVRLSFEWMGAPLREPEFPRDL
jgi:hypothetical protein